MGDQIVACVMEQRFKKKKKKKKKGEIQNEDLDLIMKDESRR